MTPPATAHEDGQLLLEMRGITKRFPGVLALSDVDFDVRRGEVHVLVGENGAGKSTLMKILAGVYQRDAGEVIFQGQSVNFTTPRQAQDAGIVTIYQELNQVPYLSVTENIFLGSEIQRGIALNWSAMHDQARQLLAKLHLDIDPRTLVNQLGVAQQQMVEVAKALHHKASLIIMDEPTSSLSIREINDLFAIVRELRSHGASVIYISHHLEETFEVADRTTVLRDGRRIATQPASELNVDKLIRLMVGRDLSEKFPKEPVPRGAEMLRVEGLSQGTRLRDISFSAYGGEVLGIAGLVGAGRTELVRAIFGADPIDGGKVYVTGKPAKIGSPQDAVRCGIGLLTEDRKQQGLCSANERAGEYHPLDPRPPDTRADDRPAQRDLAGAALHQQHGDQGLQPGSIGRQSVGRHPAEGGAEQMAGDRAQGVDLRRADRAASTSAPRSRSTG